MDEMCEQEELSWGCIQLSPKTDDTFFSAIKCIMTASYLNYKYLWLSYQTLALVSSEHVRDCLNFDLGIICVDMIVFTVTQEHTNKAVSIAVVIPRGWNIKCALVNGDFHIQKTMAYLYYIIASQISHFSSELYF